MTKHTFGNVEPFTPEEVVSAQIGQIPDVVFTAVNTLLAKSGLQQRISITKRDLLDEISRLEGPSEHELLSNHWLDIEPAYRRAGWSVEYDSGDYGSSPGAFRFVKRPTPTDQR